MRDLTAFTARLNALFGAGHEARYNAVLGRYEVLSPSADGKTVSQLWQWLYHPTVLDPETGLPLKLEPDPETGLLPFRELDTDSESEIIRNMQASFVGSPTEGRGSWKRQFRSRLAKNNAAKQAKVQARAELLSSMILEMNIKRPWLKFHSGSAKARRIAQRV